MIHLWIPATMKSSACMTALLVFFYVSAVFSDDAPAAPDLRALLSLKSNIRDPLRALADWRQEQASSTGVQRHLFWCSWPGIDCDEVTTRVTSLDLSGRNLSGKIPPEIGLLAALSRLNLSRNLFDGPLPPAIFQLTNLTSLDVSRNNFNSTFPPGISNLTVLTFFNAYSNSFTGRLPEELPLIASLEHLNLGGNYFGEEIPNSYGSFAGLKLLHLAGNALAGLLPAQIGSLSKLERLEMGYNMLHGSVPGEFGLLENLQYLDLSNCRLHGNLTEKLGNITTLQVFLLFNNEFSGIIPDEYLNLKALKILDLSNNRLSGTIPAAFGSLTQLEKLSLMQNHLTGVIPRGIGELPNLDKLSLWNNSLTGAIPPALGSSGKLEWLDLSSNSLTGPIPPDLCRGNKLFKLLLFSNNLFGGYPTRLANCSSLSRIRIQNNRMSGVIPSGIGLLPNLSYLDLSMNNFSGQVPASFGDARKLQYLNISGNAFLSNLPREIWRAPSLQIFSAGWSKIVGRIPFFIGCRTLYKIELQGNLLSGSIPSDIDHCKKLLSLNLGHNFLSGIIPWEISSLPSITSIDLSRNNLTGTIPSNFQNCGTLESFNVSYNLLTGSIPESGPVFPNLHPSSFAGNQGLCGAVVSRPCMARTVSSDDASPTQGQEAKYAAGAILWVVASIVGVGLVLVLAGARCFHANYAAMKLSVDQDVGPWKLTVFQKLNFTADTVIESLSINNKIIGMGSTGTVYKAVMPSGEIIAVKKLWGCKHKENVSRRKGVLAEVDLLRNVRHRNIVRLLGYCSNRESTLLLYEYMPNGNLDDLLHGKNKAGNLIVDWVVKYKIAVGVAQGICYLHHDCHPVIVHRDVKPSNILLDAEMEARVADFGVAKLIHNDESMSVIAGSYGYIAPEYAYTLQVDEKSDIYSYGVLLMEMIVGKRSVDPEFGDGRNIVDWIRSKIKSGGGLDDAVENSDGSPPLASVKEEMMHVLRIAILCTSQSPADRPSMRDVVLMLQEAKPTRKHPDQDGAAGGVAGDGPHRPLIHPIDSGLV